MNILPLFVAIPLGGAFLTAFIGKKIKSLPDWIANLATISGISLAIYSLYLVSQNGVLVYKVGGWIAPIGIAMVADSLTSFMLITVNLVAWLVSIYSISYMERYTAKWKFYTLFLLMLAGMNGVIITGDMFNLFVFLEIASVASYALVAFGTEHEELEASFKYMVMGTLASLFILLGIALLYSYTSTLNMADMARVLQDKGLGRITLFVSVLFIMGFGLKSAIVPFHAWLPDAHPSAPAPISAMLSGVLIKSLGIYALLRIFYGVLGIGTLTSFLGILLFLGTISMVIGALLALGQRDLKRMFAYSSISQIGYIIFAFGLGTPLGWMAGLFHLFNHAIFKSLLFLNSGAIVYATETRDLEDLGGLTQRMPVTATTSLIGSLSISGIPPFSGFWSKLLIVVAAIQADRPGLALTAVLVSVITLAYYLKFQKLAFFGTLKEKWNKVAEVPLSMKLSMVALAAISLFGGVLLIPPIREVFLAGACDALAAGFHYADLVCRGVL